MPLGSWRGGQTLKPTVTGSLVRGHRAAGKALHMDGTRTRHWEAELSSWKGCFLG